MMSPLRVPDLAAFAVCLLAVCGSEAFAQEPGDAPQPGLVTERGILDAEDPDIVMTLRGGVEVSPAYLGSDDMEFGPDVSFRLDYLRLPNGFEFGSSRSVGFVRGFALSGSVRVLSERDSDEYSEIRGLDDTPFSFEAGFGLGYEQRNYRAFADVRYGIIGHNTWVGEVGADGIIYPAEGLTVTAGPRLLFGTDRFSDTYFGVNPEGSAASGLRGFDPDGGLISAGVEVGARYLFNERWGVEGEATWDRLLNDAADSPITELGSEDQLEVRIGVTRRISLDF